MVRKVRVAYRALHFCLGMERVMLDTETFLTTLYVVVDDFGQAELPPGARPGPSAALTRSELLTLAMFGQWQGFGSERGFYRYAQRHLRPAFPTLPTRAQFNRQLRQQTNALIACALSLVRRRRAELAAYEALLWIRPRCRPAMPSGAVPAGFRGRRRSVGATDGVGSKACACCWLSRPRA